MKRTSVAAAFFAWHLTACQASAPPRTSEVEAVPAPQTMAALHADEHANCGDGSEHCGSSGSCCVGAAQPGEEAAAPLAGLRLLQDHTQICMVRDQFMGRPQLPVVVGSSTYYGCCPGCANRLANDARARAAVDPVSGNSIDKALAVVGVNARGGLLYFESAENFRTYAASVN